MKVGDRVYRDASARPILDIDSLHDEKSAGLLHGNLGTIMAVDENGGHVLWDREKHKGTHTGNWRYYSHSQAWVKLAEHSFDLSKCCSCPYPNEYNHDVNCDSGWRCSACRLFRSML